MRVDSKAGRSVLRSEGIMIKDTDPGTTFRGLPLTPEQDSEIRHYIHTRQRCGEPWDTEELRSMIADMLDPPEVSDEDNESVNDSMRAEHSMAQDEAEFDDDVTDSGHEGHGHHSP
jgi:hypothetical protein